MKKKAIEGGGVYDEKSKNMGVPDYRYENIKKEHAEKLERIEFYQRQKELKKARQTKILEADADKLQ